VVSSVMASPPLGKLKGAGEGSAKFRFYTQLKGLVGQEIRKVTAAQEAKRESFDRLAAERAKANERFGQVKQLLVDRAVAHSKLGMYGKKRARTGAKAGGSEVRSAPADLSLYGRALPEAREPREGEGGAEGGAGEEEGGAEGEETTDLVLFDSELVQNIRDLLRSESGGTYFQSTYAVQETLDKNMAKELKLADVVEQLKNVMLPAEWSNDAKVTTPDTVWEGESSGEIQLSDEVCAAMALVNGQLPGQLPAGADPKNPVWLHWVETYTEPYANAVAALYNYNACRTGTTSAFAGQTQLEQTATRARVAVRIMQRRVGTAR